MPRGADRHQPDGRSASSGLDLHGERRQRRELLGCADRTPVGHPRLREPRRYGVHDAHGLLQPGDQRLPGRDPGTVHRLLVGGDR